MAEILQYLENAEKVFVFDQVYPLSAATEQANQKKLNAFGMLAKLNPFKRPKEETVLLSKHVLRYEPFWHVVTTRSVDYSRELTYPVEIGNAYAKKFSSTARSIRSQSRELNGRSTCRESSTLTGKSITKITWTGCRAT